MKAWYTNGNNVTGDKITYKDCSAEEAARQLALQHPNTDCEYIHVDPGSFWATQPFTNPNYDPVAIRKKEAVKQLDWLNQEAKSKGSYFQLDLGFRIHFTGMAQTIIKRFQNKALIQAEIDFLNAWAEFPDRARGESLIQARERSLPKAERGQTKMGHLTGAMLGLALSRSIINSERSADALEEMQAGMEDLSDDVAEIEETVTEEPESGGFDA